MSDPTFKKALTAKPEFSVVSGHMVGETGANAANGLGDVGAAWLPIESAPEFTDVLVSVTYNLGCEGDGYETVMWVDKWWRAEDCDCEQPCREWFSFPHLIHIPCAPTHWMPLPPPPTTQEARHD